MLRFAIGICLFFSAVGLADFPNPFVNDEAYYAGPCMNDKTKGNLWEFMANGEIQSICCLYGQMPNGETDIRKPRCRPADITSCPKDMPFTTYCMGDSPFVSCCPAGQMSTCNPDSSKARCFDPKLTYPFLQNDC